VVGNKGKDLRERESVQGPTERKKSPTGALDCLENTFRKRLHVKQSIEHTLNSHKGHSHLDSHTYMSADAKKQLSPGEHVPSLGNILFTHHHPGPTLPTSYCQEGHRSLAFMTYPPLLHPISGG
jgi:hypothetical protein